MKHHALILALLLVVTNLLGCHDDWKSDSCHIIQTAPPAEICSCKTPTASTYHWLEAFKTIRTTPVPIAEPSPDPLPPAAKRASQPTTKQKKAPPAPGTCIDINQADEKQLATLPGIGIGRAQKIVQIREKRPFKRKSDITRIKGIGRKSYQKMSAYICDIP